MNIALLTKCFVKNEVDAAISTVLRLAKELNKKGHKVTIITDRGYVSEKSNSILPEKELIEGIEVWRPYHIKTKYFGRTCMISAFISMMVLPGLGLKYVEKKKKIAFDAVHTFGASHFSALNQLFGKSKNRIIRRIHSVKAISSHGSGFNIGSNFYAFLLNAADCITAPLESIRKNLVKSGVKKPISVIPSFVDLKIYSGQAKISKAQIRKKLALPQNKKLMLYYGHFLPAKGAQELMKVFREIGQERGDIALILLHPSYPNKKDAKLIEECNVNNNIIFRKGRANIADYLHAADAVVLPYKSLAGTEANPLCIIETLAAGTALITSRLPELEEMIDSKKEVTWIKSGDKEQLKQAIITANHNKHKRYPLSALRRFDAKTVVNQIEKLYRS